MLCDSGVQNFHGYQNRIRMEFAGNFTMLLFINLGWRNSAEQLIKMIGCHFSP